MSMPELTKPDQSFEEVLSEVAESIAAEENALSRMIEAETDKLRFAADYIKGGGAGLDKLIEINKSATALMEQIKDMQIILKDKLSIVVSRMPPGASPGLTPPPPIPPPALPPPSEYAPYRCVTCGCAPCECQAQATPCAPEPCAHCTDKPCECEACKAGRNQAGPSFNGHCQCEKCKAKQCSSGQCGTGQCGSGQFNTGQFNQGYNPEMLLNMLKSQQQSPLFAMRDMIRFVRNPLPSLVRAMMFRQRRC